jgi:uncharacterized repeat protein (TIGR03847 family)
MSNSFRFEQLDAFVPGTLGPPGQRVFYLQARRGDQVVSFRLEKEQVGMLGRYLGQLASALGDVEPDRDIAGLIEPVLPEWVIGSLAVGVDEEAKLIHVTAEELVAEEDEGPYEDFTDEDVDELLDTEPSGAEAHFTLALGQAAAFAEAALELIEAGRPPCRLCGRPMEPEGHACPRWN